MGTESSNPLNELKDLDSRVDGVTALDGLKPIFSRLDELGRLHSGDFEVQLAVTEIKQRVVDRGKLLKQGPPAASPPGSAPPARVADAPTVRLPGPGSPATPPRVVDAPTVRLPASRLPDTSTLPETTPQQGGTPPKIAPVVHIPPAPVPPPPIPVSPTPVSPAQNLSEPLSTTGPIETPAVPATFQPPPTVGGDAPAGPPSQPPKAPAGSWKRPLVVGAISGALIAILLVAVLVNQARKRNAAATAPVPMQVATSPPGASVRVNGELKCTSNCAVNLPPGVYQVTAFLDGYEPSASNVTVTAGQPAGVDLFLEPQAQVLRILTDLDQGKVTVDDQPAADLQDGQFVLEKVPPGPHTVKVTSRTGEATFTVEIAEAKKPVIMGPVAARNLLAVMVTSLGSSARVVTNKGPLKLALNGQPQADATTDGVDLANFQPGVAEIVVGEGKEQHEMKESFTPAPTLTAFLKSDLNIGTLIVSAGEDDVRVFLNNKEYPRRTQRGQVRVQTIGAVNVRVAKDGYEPVTAQTAEVKKGSEVRLEFKLQALPKMAMLQIRGATPGAEVLLDQKMLGNVGDDGTLTNNAIPPGEHTVEIRKEQFLPRRFQRPFRAGQAVSLNGSDVVLSAALGSIRLARTPADATVVYRRADDTQSQDARGNQMELPPGTYIFTARAPGYTEKSERVQLSAGDTRAVELALARIVVQAAPPPPKIGGMSDFDDPGAWKQDGKMYTHRGAAFLSYKLPAKGVFSFNVELLRGGNIFRGGRIRWALQYQDARNYDLFELDQRYLWSKVIIAGKTYERGKYDHNLTDTAKSYSVQVEVSADKLVHKVQNGSEWTVIDSWSEPGRNFTEGKFGFLVQGNDEIGITDFKFTPR